MFVFFASSLGPGLTMFGSFGDGGKVSPFAFFSATEIKNCSLSVPYLDLHINIVH